MQKDDGEPSQRRWRTRKIRGNILFVRINQRNTKPVDLSITAEHSPVCHRVSRQYSDPTSAQVSNISTPTVQTLVS